MLQWHSKWLGFVWAIEGSIITSSKLKDLASDKPLLNKVLLALFKWRQRQVISGALPHGLSPLPKYRANLHQSHNVLLQESSWENDRFVMDEGTYLGKPLTAVFE